jgi:hypothetical protein
MKSEERGTKNEGGTRLRVASCGRRAGGGGRSGEVRSQISETRRGRGPRCTSLQFAVAEVDHGGWLSACVLCHFHFPLCILAFLASSAVHISDWPTAG